jgi:SPP1 family predicted phage head-tail adaptor
MEQIVQTGAGLLAESVAFDKRTDEVDDSGNYVGAWVEQFATRAQFIWLRGGEAVNAERLQSRQPLIVRIRKSAAALLVDADYRIRNMRTGHEYQIRTVTPDVSRGMVDIMAEAGVAI